MALFDARRVGRVPGSGLEAVAFRNQAPGFDPRSGDGARRQGGRFNPPHSFPVLYLCLTQPCVVAELSKQAERQGLSVDDLLPRELWQITCDLTNVLDLTSPDVRSGLDLSVEDLVRDDYRLTREIGEAAHAHGFQALKSVSATGVDEVLAIFPERLAGAVLETTLLREWSTPADLLR